MYVMMSKFCPLNKRSTIKRKKIMITVINIFVLINIKSNFIKRFLKMDRK